MKLPRFYFIDCPSCGGSGRIVNPKALGQLMRKRRLIRGLSLRTTAKRMQISAAYLSTMERGDRAATEEMLAKFNEVIYAQKKH